MSPLHVGVAALILGPFDVFCEQMALEWEFGTCTNIPYGSSAAAEKRERDRREKERERERGGMSFLMRQSAWQAFATTSVFAGCLIAQRKVQRKEEKKKKENEKEKKKAKGRAARCVEVLFWWSGSRKGLKDEGDEEEEERKREREKERKRERMEMIRKAVEMLTDLRWNFQLFLRILFGQTLNSH
ncbi:uncharacterized protein MONOS_17166 [Monocercomonoides exilis]|uniref:uncharacterized protein n=1 Tax=Monocercomonoides exilis TaxID=2049356 RepID=UPI00355A0E92|nr:hypothetical protein MONOS_17166 [Monocercomonoides exilis]